MCERDLNTSAVIFDMKRKRKIRFSLSIFFIHVKEFQMIHFMLGAVYSIIKNMEKCSVSSSISSIYIFFKYGEMFRE